MKKEDFIGKRFGKGIVVCDTGNYLNIGKKRPRRTPEFKLLCDCGNYYTTHGIALQFKKTYSCGCLRRNDLTGQKYGKLTALKPICNNKRTDSWECSCECGKTKVVKTKQLTKGETTSCGCISACFHSTQINKSSSVYRCCKRISYDAKYKKREFNILPEDLISVYEQQNGLCFFTKIPISFDNNTVSVDRIDSSKGYLKDNIQLVCRKINYMKNTLSNEEFLQLCNLVAKNA